MQGAGVEPSPLLLQSFIGLLHQPRDIDGDDSGIVTGMNEWQGKPKYLGKTWPSTALSTTDPTRFDTRWNPGRRGENPAANRLS
jgi:hypothetical protein